jgi:hypothetical protein
MSKNIVELIDIPPYKGLEISYEDIIYNYFRTILNKRGYTVKVKKTGFPEIDMHIPSYSKGNSGKGKCDGYIFSNNTHASLCGFIELESTGNIKSGIEQILFYIDGFIKDFSAHYGENWERKLINKTIQLIVYDGQNIYLSKYNINERRESIIFDNVPISQLPNITDRILTLFPEKERFDTDADEKNIIESIATLIRGHDKLQKNKAIIMTILASIYGATQKSDLKDAITNLKQSQLEYDKKLYNTWNELNDEIDYIHDEKTIDILYKKNAAKTYQISQNRGMDLYGFIYEELATKDSKKEQGEYYTPRHTIKPIIRAVYSNYLNWDREEICEKIVLDPFCGSGGFLYEYIHLLKTQFNLEKEDIDKIAEKSIYGYDKNNTLAAYLNLYLIGDGKANIDRVKTSINWRNHFFYTDDEKKKYGVKKIDDLELISQNIRSNIGDINKFITVYAGKKYKANFDTLKKVIGKHDPINDYLLTFNSSFKDINYSGNVDLLLTNVPYGVVTKATEQIIEGGSPSYGNSLEVNALRECIDFLRPAELKNNKEIREGGIGVIIVPDSILENPTNKPIRDYLITRCNILGIISLPRYTFSPYAMEKTYVLVIQKLAPQQFNENREIDVDTFMYYSICDGKANSESRFPTNHMHEVEVKTLSGKTHNVVEFLHNDFDPCFQSYEINDIQYKSKLERAWDNQTFYINPEWDQQRISEVWDKNEWGVMSGRKWGFYKLVHFQREVKTVLNKGKSHKKIAENILSFINQLDLDERAEYLRGNDYDILKEKLLLQKSFTPKEKRFLNALDCIVARNENGEEGISLVKLDHVTDIDLNPDSSFYLGDDERDINVEHINYDIEKMQDITEERLIDYFRNRFVSKSAVASRLMDKFYVIQGTQFSKQDAYLNVGNTPVFTAATDGPAYFVDDNIKGRDKLCAPALIWSRKGAKAGTIQLFDQKDDVGNYLKFYVSDVSGAIIPKEGFYCNLLFMKYYIAGQVKRELQSRTGNAQLNKTKLENLPLVLPENQDEIANLIMQTLYSQRND